MFIFLWGFFFLVGHSEAMATALDFKVAASFTGKAIVLDLPIPTGMKSQFFKTHFGPENDQSLNKKKKKKKQKNLMKS